MGINEYEVGGKWVRFVRVEAHDSSYAIVGGTLFVVEGYDSHEARSVDELPEDYAPELREIFGDHPAIRRVVVEGWRELR